MEIENILWRTCLYKFCQNLSHERIVDTGSKLAIRKGTCTAFTKLHIRARVKAVTTPKLVNIRMTAVYIPASFQNKRAKAISSQRKSRKHTSRTKPHYHRRIITLFTAHSASNTSRKVYFFYLINTLVLFKAVQDLLFHFFVCQFYIENVNKPDGCTLITSGIYSLTHNNHPSNKLRWQFKTFSCQIFQ